MYLHTHKKKNIFKPFRNALFIVYVINLGLHFVIFFASSTDTVTFENKAEFLWRQNYAFLVLLFLLLLLLLLLFSATETILNEKNIICLYLKKIIYIISI